MYTKFAQKLKKSFHPCEDMIVTLLETIQAINAGKIENSDQQEYVKHSTQFRAFISDDFNEVRNISANEYFNDFTEIREYISTFKESVKEIQERDCFYSQSSDGFVLKIRKLGKRFFLKINWFLIGGLNLFRRLFKFPVLPNQYWTHIVKEQQLAELVYFIHFLEKVNPIITDVLQARQEVFQQIKSVDKSIESVLLNKEKSEELDLEQILSQCSGKIEIKKAELDTFFIQLKKDLDELYKKLHTKAGTIEFPSRQIKARKLNRKAKKQINKQEGLLNSYERRAFALFEHWRLVYEIRFSNLTVTDYLIGKKDDLKNLFDKVLISKDTSHVNILESAFEKITEKKELADVQDNLLTRQLLQAGMPAYMESLMEIDLVTPLEELKVASIEEFENTKANYLLPVKKTWVNDPGVPKLRDTNVLDIVRGCLSESVEATLLSKKDDMISGIQLSLSNAEELTGIVEYALEYYNTKDIEDATEQHTEFANGIERALIKSKENKQHNLDLSNKLVQELDQINNDFIKEITNAISPDNLNQKQTEMIRKKRIRDARNVINTSLTFGKEIFTKSHVRILSLVKQAREKYTFYRELLGLSNKSETIGSELSNYLSETEKAIASLPLMYQRLFKISPLTKAKFRIERPQVIQKLERSYSNWTNGKFAPTCLVGETGSGMTSTVNIFEEKFGHQYSFYRFNLDQRIATEEDFIKFLKTVFHDLKFESIDELLVEIQKLKGRRIVVLENIQQLFIRKMHGSKNLTLFFRLISQSNNKIFWLSTCLLYTFRYLDYTLDMNNYYGHTVYLDTLNKEDVTDVITKRHKFSGFKLNFQEPKNFNPKRSYKKMSKLEKQAYLQDDFFKRLYNYSQNNLSLALVFWMRSVVNVEDNNFYIEYKHLDYSFFSSLSNMEVATLHAILLHGSLSLEEHTEIFDWQKEESQSHLMVFTDDGILIKKEDHYLINPLVYRQVVNHLDVLNYIH